MPEETEVLSFTNIDKEDFIGKYTGKETIIKAGETKLLPRYLAILFCKHLVDKILLRNGHNWTEENLRKPLEDKVLGTISVPQNTSEPVIPSNTLPVVEPEFTEIPKENLSDVSSNLTNEEIVIKKKLGRPKKIQV
jgi:hypothetical protein